MSPVAPASCLQRCLHRLLMLGALLLCLPAVSLRAQTSSLDATADPEAITREDSGRYIVLAVDNPLRQVPVRAGSSLPAYGGAARYGVGSQAASTLSALQREHGLREVAAWPIVALGLHCVVMGLPEGGSREAMLATLAQDRRVRLAQPLQQFAMLADAPPRAAMAGAAEARDTTAAATEAGLARYNDPYVKLQRGFAEIGAAQAHRTSLGRDVPVAVIDTGADIRHPDLQGRIALQRDLVAGGGTVQPIEQDRHGTEVAGIIAAVANNGQGIVGVAPEARVSIYKACWYAAATRDAPARCNSFTLAKALAAVLDSDARIVNLSLGGPADPLLELLLQQLLRQHRIVVAALPASGRREGFPAATPGVIVVGHAGSPPQPGVLTAPGRDVLTLVPGGRYDFASGSSMAAAHASGVVALLLAAGAAPDGAAMQALLAGSVAADKPAQINAEAALAQLAQRARLAAAR